MKELSQRTIFACFGADEASLWGLSIHNRDGKTLLPVLGFKCFCDKVKMFVRIWTFSGRGYFCNALLRVKLNCTVKSKPRTVLNGKTVPGE